MATIADLVVEKLTPIYGDHDYDSLLRMWWEFEGGVGHPTHQQLYTYHYAEAGSTVADKMYSYWSEWLA